MTILKCLFGPRLYHVYQKNNSPGHQYEPGLLEKTADAVIKCFRFCWSFSCWTSPVLLVVMYFRVDLSHNGLTTMTSYGATLSLVLVLSLCVRALGRFITGEYTEFLGILKEAQRPMTPETKMRLSQYDFDFSAWPVEYCSKRSSKLVQLHESADDRTFGERMKNLPFDVLSYIAIHTFGRRFVYPGTVSLMQTLVAQVLLQGRIKLIEECNGVRYKLKTEDQNHIASIVVDRRNNPCFENGKTLVICCEGNAGFYEIGCMATPLEAGYSTLGWNHPGFTGSTGVPFPSQEQYAVDAVVQFATTKLGFSLCDIILYGWSIGGYVVTWAAMNYPQVQSVILDASFDDITPLALARMPQSWNKLVKQTMRKYMNLRNADQLCKYPGPVLIIRRSKDEMISTIDPSIKSSNRGNLVLMQLLQFRYPNIVNEETRPILHTWLANDKAGQAALCMQYNVDEDQCCVLLRSYIEEHSYEYPMSIGRNLSLEDRKQLVLYLASKYMDEFDATHCQPLPSSFFRPPWTIPQLSSGEM